VAGLEGLRIVVTGASGFVGSNVVRFLAHEGVEPYLLVRPESSRWRLQGIREPLRIHPGDLTDGDSIRRWLRSVEPVGVVHLASYGVGRGQVDSRRMLQVNVEGTSTMLDAAVESGCEWMINTGSVSETGTSPDLPEEPRPPMAMDYGQSKALATRACATVARERGFHVVTLRLFTPFGPFEDPERLIPTVLLGGIRNAPVKLSVPSSVRDFIFVRDVETAYGRAAELAGRLRPGTVLEVGSGRLTSVGDVVTTVEQVLERKLAVEWGSYPSTDSLRGTMRPAQIAGTSSEIHWSPSHTLRSGLDEAYRWFLANGSLYPPPKDGC